MISIKRSRGFMIFSMVVMLVFVSGCAKKTVLKEDSVSKEPLVAASEPVVKAPEKSTLQDAVTARKRVEQEQAAKEAALKAQEEAKKKEGLSESVKKPAVNIPQEIKELADIHFDFDKYNLTDEARASLQKNTELLAKNKDVKIVIEGNCDERGTAEYNLALGQRRAEAAAKYLIDMGIDAKRIKTVSYGLERPLDPRHNEEAWAKNRRDHFVVAGVMTI